MATIQKRNGSYVIRVSCGYDVNGKQIRQSMTWTPSPNMTKRQIEKELNRQATLFEEAVKTGQIINSGIKFETVAEEWLKTFCQKHNLKYVTVHSFRHLNATLLISNGVDIKTVSRALGHSQTSTTLNIYAHSFAEQQARASEAIANALRIRKKEA